jgi:hypothetical protein
VFDEVLVRSVADWAGDGIGDMRGLADRLDDLLAATRRRPTSAATPADG